MEIGKTLYVKNRKAWRAWLEKNHDRAKEIWLIYYKKESDKLRIPYNDAVEEALCFGWIDSTVKRIDDEKYAQRFSPRRSKSNLSEMNRQRVRRLIKEKRMTPIGLAIIEEQLGKKFVMPADILRAIRKNPDAWKHFQKFPVSYKHIRVAFIEGARTRPDIFRQRLAYFIKMTAANKKFGMVQ